MERANASYPFRAASEAHGSVTEAKFINDRETGRSRGFGFATFTDPEDASAAIAARDGRDLDGRTIRLNLAANKPRREGGGSGGPGR